jgi:hypothetical protein
VCERLLGLAVQTSELIEDRVVGESEIASEQVDEDPIRL